uniref:Uncharacterized protein n=1 Tax=Solanum lycopersicum TaxID=4081 RepID=A0A494G8A5_SOLLC
MLVCVGVLRPQGTTPLGWKYYGVLECKARCLKAVGGGACWNESSMMGVGGVWGSSGFDSLKLGGGVRGLRARCFKSWVGGGIWVFKALRL